MNRGSIFHPDDYLALTEEAVLSDEVGWNEFVDAASLVVTYEAVPKIFVWIAADAIYSEQGVNLEHRATGPPNI